MQIGLKNSLDIVNDLSSIVDFAVNEQCAQLSECQRYDSFLALNKPVFHIEYPIPLNAEAATSVSCNGPSVDKESTILKDLKLNGITYYCDGSYVDTPTVGGGSARPRPSQSPKPPQPPRPSSTRPVSSQRSSTTHSDAQPSILITETDEHTWRRRWRMQVKALGSVWWKRLERVHGLRGVCAFLLVKLKLMTCVGAVYVQGCVTSILLSVLVDLVEISSRLSEKFGNTASSRK
jgi:hypothetical protein